MLSPVFMRFYFWFFLIVVLCFGCKSKPINLPPIESVLSDVTVGQITDEIAKDNVVKGPAVGVSGERTAQWERFEKLKSQASDKQLLALTRHDNPTVRCYAFAAIVDRGTYDAFPILLEHLHDSVQVMVLNGCIGENVRVGDYFFPIFFSEKSYLEKDAEKRKSESRIIDSLFLVDININLDYRWKCLDRMNVSPEKYKWIKKLALIKNNREAVVILAKYKKSEDRYLISNLLEDSNYIVQRYGLRAVVNYSDPSFFPFLRKILNSKLVHGSEENNNNLDILYNAIVQYKSDQSRKLLDAVLNLSEDQKLILHSDYIYQAVNSYPDSIYNGLKYRHLRF